MGDSYENDIEGAKGAGWNAIWYNHRNHRPTGSAEPDYMVRSEKELLELLKKALESETVERITISIKPNKKNKQS